jgi:hypothetical protein
MITEKHANDVINILLHIIILFIFLSLFFFKYISKITEKSVQNELTNIIKKEVPIILDNINNFNLLLNKNNINILNWKNIYNKTNDLYNKSNKKLPEIVDNNNKLKKYSIIISILLIILWFMLLIYFKCQNININIISIIRDNIVLFIFIGIIEFLFFKNIASHYIPVEPDFVAITILDRIKNNINNKLL